MQALLEEFDAEYADVYNAGIDGEVFARAGFAPVESGRGGSRRESFRTVRASQRTPLVRVERTAGSLIQG